MTFVIFYALITQAIANPAKRLHDCTMFTAPLCMIHLNAMQCGVFTMTGDMKNPMAVSGVHQYSYKCTVDM